MLKKSFARLLLITTVLVVTGGMLVFASAQAMRNAAALQKECTEDAASKCGTRSQGDFIIWEALSRTFFTAIQ